MVLFENLKVENLICDFNPSDSSTRQCIFNGFRSKMYQSSFVILFYSFLFCQDACVQLHTYTYSQTRHFGKEAAALTRRLGGYRFSIGLSESFFRIEKRDTKRSTPFHTGTHICMYVDVSKENNEGAIQGPIDLDQSSVT